MSDFRSKFEKFGGVGGGGVGGMAAGSAKPGTPAPFRRSSAADATTPAADKSASSGGGKDLVVDLQKQLAEAEKTRAKDRQELLDKLTAQKKEFDGELGEMKKKNKLVNNLARSITC